MGSQQRFQLCLRFQQAESRYSSVRREITDQHAVEARVLMRLRRGGQIIFVDRSAARQPRLGQTVGANHTDEFDRHEGSPS